MALWLPALVVVTLVAASPGATAVTRRNDDGVTPLPLAPGRPVGSFPLSGFDSLSPFSGRVNVSIPLVHVGGRGEAGATVELRVADASWRFAGYPAGNGSETVFTATNQAWNSEMAVWKGARYSPGVVLSRPSVETAQACGPSRTWQGRMLMRINFVKSDGTEIEFRGRGRASASDPWGKFGEPVQAGGGANCAAAIVRWDPTFVAADGSGATFVANGELTQQETTTGASAVSGWLYLKGGTKYAVSAGHVVSIIDRNGNTITYTYASTGDRELTLIRDSLGRTVTFTYHVTPCWTDSTAAECDQIRYTGQGVTGGTRMIEVGWDALKRRPRPARLGTVPDCGVGSCTIAELFPYLASLKRSDQPTLYRLQNRDWVVNPRLVAWVQLPTGGSLWTGGQGRYRYDFYYNRHSEIAAVRLPTEDLNHTPVGYDSGGIIEYDWGNYAEGETVLSGYDQKELMVSKRRVSQRRELTGSILKAQTFIEDPTSPDDGVPGTMVRVRDCIIHEGLLGDHDRLGRYVKHFYHGYINTSLRLNPNGYPDALEGRERKTQIFDGTNTYGASANDCTAATGPGSQLKQVVNTWEPRAPRDDEFADAGWDVRLAMQATTLGDASSTVDYVYDDYNNVTDETVHDYSGGMLRHIHREFSNEHWPVPPAQLRSFLLSESVSGPSGLETTTTYVYDEGGEAALRQYGSVVGYTGPPRKRGNPTTITACSPGSYPGCHATVLAYDQVGNVVSKTVAAGESAAATTEFDYTDRYAVLGSGQCPSSTFGGNTPERTFAFATQVRAPNGFVTKLAYDRYWGQPIRILRPTGLIDEANSESDPFARVTSVKYACGAVGRALPTRPQLINFVYHDDRVLRERRQQASAGEYEGDSDVFQEEQTEYDALGRQIWVWRKSDDTYGGLQFTRTGTVWDGMGRKAGVSNPSSISVLGPYTFLKYDALDRPRMVTVPDDKPGWSTTTSTYLDNQVTVSDPQGHWKRSVLDALGRVKQVNDGDNNLTNYSYDARGNLTQVKQGIQTRSFEYDGFGLLRKARNPENGEVRYTYDGRGNLLKAEKFDLGGTSQGTTVMTYDPLNRIETKTYSGNFGVSTPDVTYTYDEGGPNNVGMLTTVRNGVSSTRYTYDDAGNLKTSSQTTAGKAYNFLYDIDRLGNVRSETYPSGRTITTDVDRRNQVRAVSETTPIARTLATMPTANAAPYAYSVNGVLQLMNLGNGTQYTGSIWERSMTLRGIQVKKAGALLAAYGYWYRDSVFDQGNDGNVYLARTTVPDPVNQSQWVFDQVYTYDGLDRLRSMTESRQRADGTQSQASTSQLNAYDRHGNRWIESQTGFPVAATAPTHQTHIDPATNRVVAGKAAYDALGNNTLGPNSQTLVYDAEGRLTGTTDGKVRYEYDGEGHRVSQTVNGAQTLFVYDGLGRLAAEHGVEPAPPSINYITTDLLGSVRLVTSASGALVSRHDFAPFGEELTNTQRTSLNIGYGAADNLPHRFTGKERDSSTSLDYFGARYFSSQQGRFMSPDPVLNSGRPWLPQSWNRYAYVLGCPTRFTDPHGLWEFGQCNYTPQECGEYQLRVRQAYRTAVTTRDKLSVGSPDRGPLDRALDFLGGEDETNGVRIAIVGLDGATAGRYSASEGTVNVDVSKVFVLAGRRGFSADVNLAGVLVHEGTHGADHKDGKLETEWPERGGTLDLEPWRATEEAAFEGESYVHKHNGSSAVNGVWNRSWSKVDGWYLARARAMQLAQQAVNKLAAQAGQKGVNVTGLQ